MLNVSAVAGFKAQIPCDIDPASRSEVVSMVFWYKDERDGEPIYSLDARGKSIAQAKLWSDSYVFDERATMRTNVDPAKLEIDPLEATDAGVYRCRVDYKNSPTRNQKVNLTVIGECVLSLLLQCVSSLSLSLSVTLSTWWSIAINCFHSETRCYLDVVAFNFELFSFAARLLLVFGYFMRFSFNAWNWKFRGLKEKCQRILLAEQIRLSSLRQGRLSIASHRDVKMFVQSQVQMLERRLIEILLACFIDENVSLSFRMYVIGFRFISIQNCTLERDTD